MPKPDINKVALTTITFWVLKTIVTTVGDLTGDALSIEFGLGYLLALAVVFAITAALLAGQFLVRRHRPVLYWASLLSTAAVGAEISDSVDRFLHFGSEAGAGIFLVGLLAALAVWRFRCGRIGYSPISKRTDEIFYWAAAILANCLGSVFGDLIGDKLGLGTLSAVAVNAGLLLVLAVLYGKTRVNRGLLFWAAFVFTRIPF